MACTGTHSPIWQAVPAPQVGLQASGTQASPAPQVVPAPHWPTQAGVAAEVSQAAQPG